MRTCFLSQVFLGSLLILNAAANAQALSIRQCRQLATSRVPRVACRREFKQQSCDIPAVRAELRFWCRTAPRPCQNISTDQCRRRVTRQAVAQLRANCWDPFSTTAPAPTPLSCPFVAEYSLFSGHGPWQIGIVGDIRDIPASLCPDGCSRTIETNLRSGRNYQFSVRDIPNARVFPNSNFAGEYQLSVNGTTFSTGVVDAAEWVTFSIAPDSCQVLPRSGGPFSVNFVFRDSVPGRYYSLFEDSIARWASVITQASSFKEFEFEGTRYNATDIVIVASVEEIDGQGEILASAIPGGFRSPIEKWRPFFGSIVLDGTDANTIEEVGLAVNEALGDIITHEIGHIIGAGTIWNNGFNPDLVDGNNYIGRNAVEQFISYGAPPSSTSLPLEDEGQANNIRAHWDEEAFTTELMTGFQSDGSSLSRITVGFLEDVGYPVAYGNAEPYSLPRSGSSAISEVQNLLDDGFKILGGTMVQPKKKSSLIESVDVPTNGEELVALAGSAPKNNKRGFTWSLR